jgi:hypothetical protein
LINHRILISIPDYAPHQLSDFLIFAGFLARFYLGLDILAQAKHVFVSFFLMLSIVIEE